jgi:hypothetical protein
MTIDVDQALELVQIDVQSALQDQLPDGEGFALDDDFDGWRDDPFADDDQTKVVVPWTWSGLNAGLLGLDATNAPVVVRGLTIVFEDGGNHLCHRYVDWLPALAQAGIILFTRPLRSITEKYDEDELREIPEYAAAAEEIAEIRERFGLDELP